LLPFLTQLFELTFLSAPRCAPSFTLRLHLPAPVACTCNTKRFEFSLRIRNSSRARLRQVHLRQHLGLRVHGVRPHPPHRRAGPHLPNLRLPRPATAPLAPGQSHDRVRNLRSYAHWCAARSGASPCRSLSCSRSAAAPPRRAGFLPCRIRLLRRKAPAICRLGMSW
jgi:hypothetical protein